MGSIIKYFKVKQGKCIRRSLKGSKVFINFLKNLYFKKYFLKKNFTVFSIIGFDYNLIVLKKSIKGFFLKTQNKFSTKGGLFLLNIKTSFSKKKEKKIKSIKKRLKKKILVNFLRKKYI